MANGFRGEGKLGDYTLVLHANAFCDIELEFGLTIEDIIEKLGPRKDANGEIVLDAKGQPLAQKVSMVFLRQILWGSLQDKHPCTVRDAGYVFDDSGFDEVFDAVTRTVESALPAAGEVEEQPRPNRASRRKAGSISSARGAKPDTSPTPSGNRPPA